MFMKTLKSFLFGAAGIAMACVMFVSCDKSESLKDSSSSSSVSLLSVSTDGVTSVATSSLKSVFNDSLTLTSDEKSFLLALREDERVSRDLYKSFYNLYSKDYFKRIAGAESSHMRAVGTLLTFYGVAYPDSTTLGVFDNAEDQALYNDLLAKGDDSLTVALKTAAYLEETNIADYTALIPNISNENILLVVNNLLKGSRNHLRVFVRILAKESGITYAPVVLDTVSYNAIIQSAIEKGGDFCTTHGKHPNHGMPGDSTRIVVKDSCLVCGGKIIPSVKDSTHFQSEGPKVGSKFRKGKR